MNATTPQSKKSEHYGPLDLDEHAAFWARDDEREGVANGRFSFALESRDFVARTRRAVFALGARDHNRFHAMCALDTSGATLVSEAAIENAEDIARYLDFKSVFRPFCDAQNAPRYGACFYSNGVGRWFYRSRDKAGNYSYLSQSPFCYVPELPDAEFLAWPQSEFLSCCQSQWQTPASEMRRAFEFDQLSVAERDAHVTRCQVGDFAQLRALLRYIGQTMWKLEPRLGERKLTLSLYQSSVYVSGVHWQGLVPLSEHYEVWRDALFGVFEPFYVGRENNPLFAEEWLKKRVALEVEVPTPTQHEQLEAHLQLRDWAKLHLSADQQRALLDAKQ